MQLVLITRDVNIRSTFFARLAKVCVYSRVCWARRGGFRGGGGGGGSRGSGPPLSYMKNDVMHTVIYAAFCMLPSLDLQDCTSF